MQNEGQYIIELLSSVLEDRKANVNNDLIDFNRLYKLAEFHYVAGMCYYSIKDVDGVPEDILMLFKRSYDKACAKEAIQEVEVNILLNEFEKAAINHMPLKGFVLKYIYPKPDMRLSADVDILFDETKSKDVKDIMLKHGYTDESTGGNHDVYYKKPFLNIEMHKRLMNEQISIHHYFNDVWSKANLQDGYNFRYELNINDFNIFQMGHLYKHFSRSGSGVRSVLDTYLFLKKYKDILDRDYLNIEFDRIGIRKFVSVYEDLSFNWFEKGFTQDDLSLFILSSGTFGLRKNSALSQIVKMNDKSKHIKVKYLLRRLFLPYSLMKSIFPILKKLPFLLPVFWIVRILRFLLNKRSHIKFEFYTLNAIHSDNLVKMAEIKEMSGIE